MSRKARRKKEKRFEYRGRELDEFAGARIWKDYCARFLWPHIGGDVLEVGAGIGEFTRVLLNPDVSSWTCLEPDAKLAERIRRRADDGEFGPPGRVRVVVGTLRDLEPHARFACVLYNDVLEHIREDRAELAAAAALMSEGGKLCVIAPAHEWLYSEFDRGIGHYRRYSIATLGALEPPGLTLVESRYLDSVGLCASAANRAFLKSSMPSRLEVLFWDRVLVRASRVLDRLFGFRVGKSILCVWRRGPV